MRQSHHPPRFAQFLQVTACRRPLDTHRRGAHTAAAEEGVVGEGVGQLPVVAGQLANLKQGQLLGLWCRCPRLGSSTPARLIALMGQRGDTALSVAFGKQSWSSSTSIIAFVPAQSPRRPLASVYLAGSGLNQTWGLATNMFGAYHFGVLYPQRKENDMAEDGDRGEPAHGEALEEPESSASAADKLARAVGAVAGRSPLTPYPGTDPGTDDVPEVVKS
jgi:hypothetical protein